MADCSSLQCFGFRHIFDSLKALALLFFHYLCYICFYLFNFCFVLFCFLKKISFPFVLCVFAAFLSLLVFCIWPLGVTVANTHVAWWKRKESLILNLVELLGSVNLHLAFHAAARESCTIMKSVFGAFLCFTWFHWSILLGESWMTSTCQVMSQHLNWVKIRT